MPIDAVRRALAITPASTPRERTIDITTTGRRSGRRHRIEIWFFRAGDQIDLSSSPGRKDWYANLLATPPFTLHLKNDVRADLVDDRMNLVNPLSLSGDAADEMRFEGKEASLGYFLGVTERIGRIRFEEDGAAVLDLADLGIDEANGDLTAADGLPYRKVYALKFEFSGERIVRLVEYANPVTFATAFGFPLGSNVSTTSPSPDTPG